MVKWRTYSDRSTTNTEEQVQAIEASESGGKPLVQKGKSIYNYVTRYQANGLASRLYNKTTNNVTSKLCSSYAWDTALKFIDSNPANEGYVDTSTINGTIIGNYKDAEFTVTRQDGTTYTKTKDAMIPLATGQTVPVNNIYDLGGNLYEWTTETTNSESGKCVQRGGSFTINASIYSSPSSRAATSETELADLVGFRITLFL